MTIPGTSGTAGADEESYLLGRDFDVFRDDAGGTPRNNFNLNHLNENSQRSSYTYSNDPKITITRIRRLTDFMGGLVVASAAFFLFRSNGHGADSTPAHQQHLQVATGTTPPLLHQAQPSLLSSSNGGASFMTPSSLQDAINRYTYYQPYHKEPQYEGLTSNYKKFQALGFQIYTGGAPAVVLSDPNNLNSTKVYNPECTGLNSYGKADDFDQDDILDNIPLTSLDLWQCYLGKSDPEADVKQRLKIMQDAVEKAHEQADDDPETLKIFIAPEFFWRGKDGAYVFFNSSTTSYKKRHEQYFSDEPHECEETCMILRGLEELVASPKYKDWLFLFGTVIVSETLPKEDTFDYLFYNFAPVYRGFDPAETDHCGKRFLVPKRYVSNIDFLTPVRQFNDSITRELYDITNPARFVDAQHETAVQIQDKKQHQKSTVVHNPFELQRKFYDRDMWYRYKDELNALGYTMIEYDWVILDNITFSVEVCLDHDVKTALKAYLADKVLGSPTLIPKNVDVYDPELKRSTGSIEYVNIPAHQAQLSLVSSSGMTINPESMALTNDGTIILQDGLSSKEGSMNYESECEHFSWHFAGGSEHISRSAKLTSTEISFEYQIHSGHTQVGIWDDLEDDSDNTWKDVIQGVFTTARYEPKITVYSPKEIAKV